MQAQRLYGSPNEAWQMIFKLRDGFQTHHRDLRGQHFKNQKGEVARDKTKNASNIKQHYRAVLYRNTPVDQSILDKLKQCPKND